MDSKPATTTTVSKKRRVSKNEAVTPRFTGTYSQEDLADIRAAYSRLNELLRVARWQSPASRRPDSARRFLLVYKAQIREAYCGFVAETEGRI